MNLLIFRHGPAGDRDEWEAQGKDDRLRPLTAVGCQEVREAAAGLTQLVAELPLLATSPLVRAVDTAAIVATSYGSQIIHLDELSPERAPGELLPRLREYRHEIVAVVGHEPHLSTLAGYLLTGRSTSFMEIKKGGACLLRFQGAPDAGRGVLQWLVTCGDLRRLGTLQ